MKICDLHGLRFEEGKLKIINSLNACILERDPKIQFIHGYHGHSFKDYLQSDYFLLDMEEEGIYLTLKNGGKNPGVSEFNIDIGEIVSPTSTSYEIPILIPINHHRKRMNLDEAKLFFDNKMNRNPPKYKNV